MSELNSPMRICVEAKTATALRDHEPRVLKYTNKLLADIEVSAETDFNVFLWFNFYNFDVMGDFYLVHSFCMLEGGVEHFYMNALHDKIKTVERFTNIICALRLYRSMSMWNIGVTARAMELWINLVAQLVHGLLDVKCRQETCNGDEDALWRDRKPPLEDIEGGYSFVKRKESTVQFVVHQLDPRGNYPSLDDIEQSYFSGHSLQDINLWSVPGLTWGEESPEADPDNSPVVAADFTRQLPENCHAVTRSTNFPICNPANVDVSRFTKNLPADSLVNRPAVAPKHPDHKMQQAVLFHLPKSKADKLKKLAMPTGTEAPWISTYDAMCAYVWRMLSKIRAPVYNPDSSSPLWWGKAVNMRPRLHNPAVPDRLMRDAVAGAFSDTAPVPPLPPGEVISDAPLSKLASYIRALTESCTEEHVERLIDFIAPIRDKRTISLRVDSHPPMSMFFTDHRSADVSSFDFGFAKPITYRHMWEDLLTAGVVLIYAPVQSSGNFCDRHGERPGSKVEIVGTSGIGKTPYE
ncbi:uncharacterized protein LY79DRAFT_583456 [Colletotrichum navitas]|uniref:Uncharacterized protein n=1 Tax=Colletotrichum navitas TaxID=681940 RepID=A0AAD8PQ35_9PEZI|nr:uncharacterized protein LY79DRAFT_583456 [Colletotrichum navitas]KAK1573695.1 hypothetical protein LY79DRAFT_583456 [Colletotrichum navitas]